MASSKKSNSSKRRKASLQAGSAKQLRLDRTRIRIVNSFEEADRLDREYWARQTPHARLRELERLRQLNYGYGGSKPTPRLQRVFKIAKLGER